MSEQNTPNGTADLFKKAWRGFQGAKWTDEVNVREFIQNNYTQYDGTEDFLAAPTEATDKLWGRLQELQKEERKKGGVLERNGHTEATVDLMRIAGLQPVGLCCEIMKEDGTMARTPDILEFAKEHQLKCGRIADLIRYRKEHEVLVGDGIAEVTPTFVLLLVDSAERPEDIDKNRAEAARIRAEERLQHQQSMHEYYQSKIALDRAMQRLQAAAKYRR